jgi:hypothetical protein
VLIAKISSKGVETPLGLLALQQIERGEHVLNELEKIIGDKSLEDEITKLSGEFYSLIPHKLGKTKAQIKACFCDILICYLLVEANG